MEDNEQYNFMNMSASLIKEVTQYNKNQSLEVVLEDQLIEITPKLNQKVDNKNNTRAFKLLSVKLN